MSETQQDGDVHFCQIVKALLQVQNQMHLFLRTNTSRVQNVLECAPL